MTDHYPIVPPPRAPHPTTATLRELVGVIPPWMDDAICAQVEPDLWFPEQGASTADPRAVCAGCPVRARCAEYAIANDERWGVWGGLTASDRDRIRKSKGAAA